MKADQGDPHSPAPPPRPSLATRAMPSEVAVRTRPRVVDVSYWTWLGACLVGVITAAATLRYYGDLQAAVLSMVDRQFPGETPAMREEVATATLAILIGGGVALILVQMALALVMRSGRGWARFALLAPALVGGLYSVAVFGTAPMATRAGLLTTTALMLIATILMFLPNARPWFDHLGEQRS
jgi:hypothetical protein